MEKYDSPGTLESLKRVLLQKLQNFMTQAISNVIFTGFFKSCCGRPRGVICFEFNPGAQMGTEKLGGGEEREESRDTFLLLRDVCIQYGMTQ